MEPVQEENSYRALGDPASPVSRRTTGHSAGKLKAFSSPTRPKDQPSIKYREVDHPVLLNAHAPPRPVLPRRSGLKTWTATAKERNPLSSSLTGPGRAGKFAELLGDTGGRYEGECLAGRPHGQGRYLSPKTPGSNEYVVQYEGEWVQGRREGMGTRYYPNGEHYTGEFVANIRHGTGRFYFSNGDMYVGQWIDDRRTGRGTYFYATGDIFMGTFVRDKREGLGTLFMLERQKKYIAEFVQGVAKCGSVLALEDDDLEPIRGQLRELALHKKLDLTSSGRLIPELPLLELRQPNKVLGERVVELRRARSEAPNAAMRAVSESSGTLSHKDLEMIRHSYCLIAAGDDLRAGILPHQLRELCVMAGLDPAAVATKSLVDQLLERKDEQTGRISVDSLMKVALHFKDTDVGDVDITQMLLEAEQTTQSAEAALDQEMSRPQGCADSPRARTHQGEECAQELPAAEAEPDCQPAEQPQASRPHSPQHQKAADVQAPQQDETQNSEEPQEIVEAAPAPEQAEMGDVKAPSRPVSAAEPIPDPKAPAPIPEPSHAEGGDGVTQQPSHATSGYSSPALASATPRSASAADREGQAHANGSRPASAAAAPTADGPRPASAAHDTVDGSRPASAGAAGADGSRPASAANASPAAGGSRPASAAAGAAADCSRPASATAAAATVDGSRPASATAAAATVGGSRPASGAAAAADGSRPASASTAAHQEEQPDNPAEDAPHAATPAEEQHADTAADTAAPADENAEAADAPASSEGSTAEGTEAAPAADDSTAAASEPQAEGDAQAVSDASDPQSPECEGTSAVPEPTEDTAQDAAAAEPTTAPAEQRNVSRAASAQSEKPPSDTATGEVAGGGVAEPQDPEGVDSEAVPEGLEATEVAE